MQTGRKIYLWGYMGSGKSYWSKRLGQYFKLPYFDLDTVFEKEQGCSIRAFFDRYGEAAFRSEEARLLRSSIDWPDGIIATGGGTPCFEQNADWMTQHGICLFLDTAPLLLLQRLRRNRFRRPLLRDKSDAELEAFVRQQLKARRPFYEKAQYQIYLPEQNLLHFLQKLFEQQD